MIYYAHTAEDENGQQLGESSGKWQLLADCFAISTRPTHAQLNQR